MVLSGNIHWKSFGSPSLEKFEVCNNTVPTAHKTSALVALTLVTTDGKSVWHFRAEKHQQLVLLWLFFLLWRIMWNLTFSTSFYLDAFCPCHDSWSHSMTPNHTYTHNIFDIKKNWWHKLKKPDLTTLDSSNHGLNLAITCSPLLVYY